MSLHFESVGLRNFGPYRSIHELDLATDPTSPIIVVHGENTLGKTSLFRALRWCLYGAPEAGRTPAESALGLREYMNRPALADGERQMEVTMKFRAGGQLFHLTRTATFDGTGPAKVSADLRVGASVIQSAAIPTEIGRQLHPQISEFFLFDGELLRDFYDRLNSDRERDLLKRSIESVLGIPALQLAGNDVALLMDDVVARQSKLIKNRGESQKAQRKLKELNSKQESLEKDKGELDKSFRDAAAALDGVKQRLAGVDELKADAREMELLEAQLGTGKASVQALENEMSQLLINGWRAPVSEKLQASLLLVQRRNDEASQHQGVLQVAIEQVNLLRTRMQGGACPQCRQQLPPPDTATPQALAEAEAALERLRAEGGAQPDITLERRISGLIDRVTGPAYKERQERLNKEVRYQFTRSTRLATVKDRLKDNDAAAIRRLGHEQEQLERTIEGFERSLKVNEKARVDLQAEQNKLAGTIRKLAGGDAGVAAEAYFFQYVNELIARSIERYQERTRAEVERTSTKMFMKLIRDAEGYDGIRIGRDYRVDLVGKRGPAMKTSEGGRQIIALSLIGALKRAAVRGGPVVLDSPLARLDLEHRANVLQEWVPELGSQAILLVQSGELTEQQAQDIMGGRIGQSYRIYRPSNDPEEADIERTR